MPSSMLEQIRVTLEASRSDAERILEEAAERARAAESGADIEARRQADQRLQRLEELRDSIDRHSEAIETAYVSMAEALAATSARLVQAAREADFTPPEWSGGIERTVELKLSETREVTLRLSRRGERA